MSNTITIPAKSVPTISAMGPLNAEKSPLDVLAMLDVNPSGNSIIFYIN